MHPVQALIAGASIGLTVAAPVGPMAVIVIHRTLTNGITAGLASGAGASTIHLLYAALAVLGIERLSTLIQSYRADMQLLAAVLLFAFALRSIRRRARFRSTVQTGGRSLLAHYASAVAFNSLNPLGFILLLGALAAMTGLTADGWSSAGALAAGVFLGSIGWWTVLVSTVAMVGLRLSPTRARSIDLVAASAMFFLGASIIARTVSTEALFGRLSALFASVV